MHMYIYIYIYIYTHTYIQIYRTSSNKRRNSKCGAYENSYYILLKAKPKCTWN